MNIFRKYCPNVFVAKCEEKHEKGEEIILTTKYGKEHECEVHNYLGMEDECFLYSITRTDGFNSQERAKRKAERLEGFAGNAEQRSAQAYEKADMSEENTGIVFGQPILVGHHSEAKHRKTIERAHNAMRKSVEEDKKAKEYERRAKYWENKANKIDLSMPESLEYFEYELEKATKKHKFYKNNPDKREHSYSLTYANKAKKKAAENLKTAVELWGTDEQREQLRKEQAAKAKKKVSKSKDFDNIKNELGGFFAFNKVQFKEGYNRIKESGKIEEGEKVFHVKAGLYLPVKNKDAFFEWL